MVVGSGNNNPLVFIGPSGCGKSTVLKMLTERGLVHVTPSWTDRPQRDGEVELEHRFVDSTRFDELAASGKLLETVQPFGLPYRYGLSRLEEVPSRVSVGMIRAPFVSRFRHYYPLVTVYQIEASFAFAEQAVVARGAEHGTRLKNFDDEILAGRSLADRIFINDGGDIAKLVSEVTEALMRDGLL